MSNNPDYVQVIELDEELMEGSSELQFQNFDHEASNLVSGSLASNNRNPPRVNPNQTFDQPTSKSSSWFNIDYYSQYFNVDTNDVTTRMLESVNPKAKFMETIQPKPDLYGPFWIPTTLIFILFIVSSINNNNTAYKELSVAAFSVYFYVYSLPVLLWGITKYFDCQPVLLEFLTFYGYSLTVWIPATLLCTIRYNAVHWIVLFLACGSSGYFMYRCLDNSLVDTNNKMARMSALGVMGIGILGFTLIVKLSILG